MDWRRQVVRSVQGYGYGVPLAISALTHSLNSSDIQAFVTTTRELSLIVGNDREHFAQPVFEAFGHAHLVRLFLPLFPFPLSRLGLGVKGSTSVEQALEERLREWIEWSPPEGDGKELLRIKGRWRNSFVPPEHLVYGTLEIGYRRADESCLRLEPFSAELASWYAAQAYRLSDRLFRSTLEGSLEAIGRAVAGLSGAQTTRLMVALPDGKSVVARTYPFDPAWPVALPEILPMQKVRSPGSPATVEFLGETVEPAESLADLRAAAEESVLLALRLDDHLMDAFSLVEDAEERKNVGTAFDPALEKFCQEACILAGAAECAFYLFERTAERKEKPRGGKSEPHSALGQSLEQVGAPISWPARELTAASPEDVLRLADSVAESRSPRYLGEDEAKQQGFDRATAVLPLDLVDRTLGVVVLSYREGLSLDDESQRALEGRLLRWAHRVSLRRLVVMNRFSLLMSRLRALVHGSSEITAASDEVEPGHVKKFLEGILRDGVAQLKALAALVTVYAHTETGPNRVERFWCCGSDHICALRPVYHGFFPDKGFASPCRKALDHSNLQVYLPGDQRRAQDTLEIVGEMREAMPSMVNEAGAADELRIVTGLLAGDGIPSTMLIFPAPARERDGRAVDLAVTVFLPGEHRYAQVHHRLILELGELIAEGFAHMRALDQRALEERHNRFLEERRERFRNAQAIDELISGLFEGLGWGPSPDKNWGLADDAVLWLLSPDRRELTFYAARGRAVEVERNLRAIDYAKHPLFAGRPVVVFPRKSQPWLNGPFQLWTFDINQRAANGSLVCDAYASLGTLPWLLSFPLVDTHQRVFGVIDLLRVRGMAIDEESALESVLLRLSLQFCWALENCRLRRAEAISRELNAAAGRHLQNLRVQEVYGLLTDGLKRELRCAHCDLFLEQDGAVLLHSTTRAQVLRSDEDRGRFLVGPAGIGSLEIVGECLSIGKPLLFHSDSPPRSTQHLSPELAHLLGDDYQFERLALPLKIEGSAETNGVVLLRGPVTRSPMKLAHEGKDRIERSRFFSEEELRLGEDLVIAVQRILRMAWLVEKQGWLVSEMAHALGQPLQALRASVDEMLLSLGNLGMHDQELRKHRQEVDRAFEAVSEERRDLAFVGSSSQPQKASTSFQFVDLAELVRHCCELLGPAAFKKEVRFFPPALNQITPLRGDRTLLRRAIQNLLDNAVKYSFHRREVVIELTEDRTGNVFLSVTNHGVGIPLGHQERIFDPWFRSQVRDERGVRPGLGIGLTIARESIEGVHQGKLSVKSEPRASAGTSANGEHTTIFTIRLNREKLRRLRPSRPEGGRGYV